MQRHFNGKDRSKWSLREFILEGSHILWEIKEPTILQFQSRNPLLVCDAHDHFLIWYFELRDFLVNKKEYFNETNPDFSKVALLLEAGDIPSTRGSAIDVEGIGYGNPYSEESKTLLRNIRKETRGILTILRGLQPKKEVEIYKKKRSSTVYKIECVKRESNTNKLKVVINENYQSPLEFNFGEFWSRMYELAEKQEVVNNKGFFDYFNSNISNPLYGKFGYKKTKILKSDGGAYIVPNISINLISNKTLAQRKNKAA